MKQQYKGIDYQWRPESTWAESESVLGALLRNVKGTNRRNLIRDFAAADIAEGIDPVLLQQSLGDEQRQRLGMIHPSFLGGEYLPDYLENEVEIARIELQSTTGDVLSIRARPAAEGGIDYRIVDEYESAFAFAPETNRRPLSLGELIGLIDGAQQDPEEGYWGKGLALCFNDANAENYPDVEELRHFTTVRSDIYPQLFEHYDRVHAEWVEEVNGEGGNDEDGENDEDAAALESGSAGIDGAVRFGCRLSSDQPIDFDVGPTIEGGKGDEPT